jgi:hypothetical protein
LTIFLRNGDRLLSSPLLLLLLLLSLFLFDVDVRSSIVDSIKILDIGNGGDKEVSDGAVGRIRILFLPVGTRDNARMFTGRTDVAAATIATTMVVGRGRMVAIYSMILLLIVNRWWGDSLPTSTEAFDRFHGVSQQKKWMVRMSHQNENDTL